MKALREKVFVDDCFYRVNLGFSTSPSGKISSPGPSIRRDSVRTKPPNVNKKIKKFLNGLNVHHQFFR